jgi:hypothetical protein
MFLEDHCPAEILTSILGYVDILDLCRCLRVCKWWHNLGIPLLYNTLRFSSNLVNSFQPNQSKLFVRLGKKPDLTLWVREIHITMSILSERDKDRKDAMAGFSKRLCDVLNNAKYLRYVNFIEKYESYHPPQPEQFRVVNGIINVLAALLASQVPRIDLFLAEIQHPKDFYPLITCLGKRLFNLTIPAHTIPSTFVLEALQHFQRLQMLTIKAPRHSIPTILDEETNWKEILENHSLQTLSLDTLTVQSLPVHIKNLKLFGLGSGLPVNTWNVVCYLQHLESLHLDYAYYQEGSGYYQEGSGFPKFDREFDDDYTNEFKSQNLRHFILSSNHDGNHRFNPIIRPILKACKHLRSFFLETWGSIGPGFLLDLSIATELSHVDICAFGPDYTLGDVVLAVQRLTGLESLKLSFPKSNLERVSLDQCKVLLSSCRRLREFVFRLSPAWKRHFLHWKRDLSRNDPTICEFNRRADLYEKFKVDIFLEPSSPCVSFCTMFVGGEKILDLYVYMEQVRIYRGHRYVVRSSQTKL